MTVRLVTVKHKGQITLPADLRRKYHLDEGSKMAIEDRDGVMVLSRPEDVVDPSAGVLSDYTYTRNPDPAAERRWVAQHIADAADVDDR